MSGTGLSVGLPVGILVGCGAVVTIVVLVLRRRRHLREAQEVTAVPVPKSPWGGSNSLAREAMGPGDRRSLQPQLKVQMSRNISALSLTKLGTGVTVEPPSSGEVGDSPVAKTEANPQYKSFFGLVGESLDVAAEDLEAVGAPTEARSEKDGKNRDHDDDGAARRGHRKAAPVSETGDDTTVVMPEDTGKLAADSQSQDHNFSGMARERASTSPALATIHLSDVKGSPYSQVKVWSMRSQTDLGNGAPSPEPMSRVRAVSIGTATELRAGRALYTSVDLSKKTSPRPQAKLDSQTFCDGDTAAVVPAGSLSRLPTNELGYTQVDVSKKTQRQQAQPASASALHSSTATGTRAPYAEVDLIKKTSPRPITAVGQHETAMGRKRAATLESDKLACKQEISGKGDEGQYEKVLNTGSGLAATSAGSRKNSGYEDVVNLATTPGGTRRPSQPTAVEGSAGSTTPPYEKPQFADKPNTIARKLALPAVAAPAEDTHYAVPDEDEVETDPYSKPVFTTTAHTNPTGRRTSQPVPVASSNFQFKSNHLGGDSGGGGREVAVDDDNDDETEADAYSKPIFSPEIVPDEDGVETDPYSKPVFATTARTKPTGRRTSQPVSVAWSNFQLKSDHSSGDGSGIGRPVVVDDDNDDEAEADPYSKPIFLLEMVPVTTHPSSGRTQTQSEDNVSEAESTAYAKPFFGGKPDPQHPQGGKESDRDPYSHLTFTSEGEVTTPDGHTAGNPEDEENKDTAPYSRLDPTRRQQALTQPLDDQAQNVDAAARHPAADKLSSASAGKIPLFLLAMQSS